MSHVTAHMGSRHLDSPPTTCHDTLCLPRGLGPACGSPPHAPVCIVCECRKGRHQPRRLWALGRQARGAECRVHAPARKSVNLCGECWGEGGAVVVTELRKSSLAPDVPSFHPRGGLAPGEKGCENGHTHTTRRQIIQDTILQSQGRREPPRIRPERRSGGAGMGQSAEVQEPGRRSGCPLAEEDFAAP